MATRFTEADFATEDQAAGTSQGIPASLDPSGGAAPDVRTQRFSQEEFADGPGESLPNYANGLTPETAVNISPVSIEDRAKLSLGNTAGTAKYLSERFKEVARRKNGDFVVKDDNGVWRRVDPAGLGDGDAWSMTQELISDAADLIKPAAQLGSQIGSAVGLAAATGGASLLAQAGTSSAVAAAVEGGLTSLGRLVGTYDATPEEQLKDIGIEAAMNLGGTYIAAGIKPTLGLIAKGLEKTGMKLSNVAPAAREMLTDTLGTLTGSGARAFETLIDDAANVSKYMRGAAVAGQSTDDALVTLANQSTDIAESIAKSARPAATELYDKMAKEVVESVGDNFTADLPTVIKSGLAPLEGVGMVQRLPESGKLIVLGKKEFVDALTEKAAQSGELSALVSDKQSLDLLYDAANTYAKYMNAKSLPGKAGAQQLMQVRRILTDATYRLKEVADDAALAPAQRMLTAMKEATDGAIYKRFDLAKPARSRITGLQSTNMFSSMNEAYGQAVTQLQPLIRATAQATKSGTREPYAQLGQQLLAAGGRNNVKKSATDGLIDTLGKLGGKGGATIQQQMRNLKAIDAASKLMPRIRKNIVSQTAAMGSMAALAAGNPGVAAGVAAGAAATSPRLAKTVVEGALKGKALLTKLPKVQLNQFLQSPQAIQAWSQGVLGSGEVQNQVFNQLMQGGIRQVRGGQ